MPLLALAAGYLTPPPAELVRAPRKQARRLRLFDLAGVFRGRGFACARRSGFRPAARSEVGPGWRTGARWGWGRGAEACGAPSMTPPLPPPAPGMPGGGGGDGGHGGPLPGPQPPQALAPAPARPLPRALALRRGGGARAGPPRQTGRQGPGRRGGGGVGSGARLAPPAARCVAGGGWPTGLAARELGNPVVPARAPRMSSTPASLRVQSLSWAGRKSWEKAWNGWTWRGSWCRAGTPRRARPTPTPTCVPWRVVMIVPAGVYGFFPLFGGGDGFGQSPCQLACSAVCAWEGRSEHVSGPTDAPLLLHWPPTQQLPAGCRTWSLRVASLPTLALRGPKELRAGSTRWEPGGGEPRARRTP